MRIFDKLISGTRTSGAFVWTEKISKGSKRMLIQSPWSHPALSETIPASTLIDISNIEKYYKNHPDVLSIVEERQVQIRPPFKSTWFENKSYGLFGEVVEEPHGWWAEWCDGPGFQGIEMHLFENTNDGSGTLNHQGPFWVPVDDDGFAETDPGSGLIILYDGEASDRDLLHGILIPPQIFTPLIALALLNFKNVSLETVPSTVSRQVRRRRERTGEVQHLFKQLNIFPGSPARQPGEEGVKKGTKRQHLARAHFKIYTPENPRFGREGDYGAFWIRPHVRGNPDHGTVYKDYKVNPPKGDPE